MGNLCAVCFLCALRLNIPKLRHSQSTIQSTMEPNCCLHTQSTQSTQNTQRTQKKILQHTNRAFRPAVLPRPRRRASGSGRLPTGRGRIYSAFGMSVRTHMPFLSTNGSGGRISGVGSAVDSENFEKNFSSFAARYQTARQIRSIALKPRTAISAILKKSFTVPPLRKIRSQHQLSAFCGNALSEV
jgi:hypothetical protein